MKNLFCDKCGKIMNIENNIAKCSCGFERVLEEGIHVSENIKQTPEIGKGFVKDKNELATFPHLCKKCGYDKAQLIELGVWFGDEAGVIRYKCGKCGYIEQDKESNT
jgi:DNA-directed RNA polymerase subunit M